MTNQNNPTIWQYVFVLFGIVVMVGFYLLPALIGFKRGIANRILLLIINLILGWTILGWIVCLIWAVAGATRAQDRFYRNQA